MRLVYLSPVSWESFAQRPHKFVEWFHDRTGAPVLWVDPYPTRFPNWGDFRRLRQSAQSTQSSSPPPWLTLLKPSGILPIEPLPGSGLVNGRFWQRYINLIDGFARDSKTWLVIGKPSALALELLKFFRHCPSLYDAMDDFPAFYSGFSRLALARREHEIVQRVNVIWASSSELKARWMHFHNDVRLVHNGLDLSVVHAVEPTPKSSKRKVFGYVGTVASWFDWDWVRALAEIRPNDEIILIGPVFEQPLGKLPSNINLLPACNHVAALNAMTQFHVGLIPFKKNALTASVDPIKYYEYRVLGLPVISTDFGEMSLRIDECGVFIAQSACDMSALADSAIQFNSDARDACAFAAQNTWEVRFDTAKLFP